MLLLIQNKNMEHIPQIPQPRPSTETIPQEWQDELQSYHPESHEYKVILQTLGELAAESGIEYSGNTQPLSAAETPSGFAEIKFLDTPAQLPAHQFEGRINGLEGNGAISASVVELATDQGNRVRVCDLRSSLEKSVGKTGPEKAEDKARLDRHFWTDLKHMTDKEGLVRSVVGVPGVYYTRAGNDTPRVYFMTVTDTTNSEKLPMVARIGDSMSIRDQKDLYRRLFGVTLKK